MDVILLEDYPQLGFVGDRMAVRNGYARNFLIPKGFAVEYSSRRANSIKQWLSIVEARKTARKKEAEELALRLADLTLEFKLRIGSLGKSFGSVGAKEIQNSLSVQGYRIDRKQVKLTEPIKKAGDTTVKIKLHSEVLVPVKVSVKAVGGGAAAEAAKAAEKARVAEAAEDSEVVEADLDTASERVAAEE